MKKVLLGISQNSQENSSARVSFLMKLQTVVSSYEYSSKLSLFKSH